MRKKVTFSALLLFLSILGYSQNLQLHYDFRHALYEEIPSPNYLTATLEMFKPDAWGSTFFFVDFDFSHERGNLGLIYAEIARDIKIKDFPIMAHIEYNGGLFHTKDYSGYIANAYLAGASYTHFLSPRAHFNTYLTYKYHAFEKISHDVQWTISWSSRFLKDKFTFRGFLDIWTENRNRDGIGNLSGKKVVILAEPQIWYNITEQFAFGSEIEISRNFTKYKEDKVYLLPTLAVKWDF